MRRELAPLVGLACFGQGAADRVGRVSSLRTTEEAVGVKLPSGCSVSAQGNQPIEQKRR